MIRTHLATNVVSGKKEHWLQF